MAYNREWLIAEIGYVLGRRNHPANASSVVAYAEEYMDRGINPDLNSVRDFIRAKGLGDEPSYRCAPDNTPPSAEALEVEHRWMLHKAYNPDCRLCREAIESGNNQLQADVQRELDRMYKEQKPVDQPPPINYVDPPVGQGAGVLTQRDGPAVRPCDCWTCRADRQKPDLEAEWSAFWKERGK